MTRQLFRLYLFLLVCFSISVTATAQTVDIPDPNLRAAIEAELGKAPGDTITMADIANLTRLSALFANISDLTGLEAATNLTELYLGDDSIADISPLKGLTNLTELYLADSSISDISPLAGLNNLTELSLGRNSIFDISPLAGLNNLTELILAGNSISDISPLAGLNNLTELFLANNSISDISPLAGLNNLTRLSLDYNPISDISALSGLINLIWLSLLGNSISDLSPLVANTGLGSGDVIIVNGNPLNNAAINPHIPALQRREVTVHFDKPFDKPVDIPDSNLRTAIEKDLGKASGATITTEDMANLTGLRARFANISDLTGLEHATNLTWLILSDNSISDISPLAGLNNLTKLYLSDNSISDISPLAGLNNLIWLDLNNNSISDLSPLADNTGLGPGDTVIVNGNPLNNAAINPHILALQRRGVTVDFGNPFDKPVDIPDSNLRTAIEKALGKASGVTITTEDMKRLTQLIAPNASITDLTGLEHATSLTWLILHNNSISDISPLKGLTNLVRLDLNNNSISDLSPLVANTGLGPGNAVLVNGNLLNNAAINPHILALQRRGVTVYFDKLVDIPDSNLRTAIEKALGKASGVTITTEDMKRLTQLIAPNASITDLTGLEHATNLTWLELHNNFISDLSLLVANTGLGPGDVIIVNGNPLNNASINIHIPALVDRGVTVYFDNPFDKPVDIPDSNLRTAIEKALGKASGATITTEDMKHLPQLIAPNASITDLTGLEGATNLELLELGNNFISDLSPLKGLTNLVRLDLNNNSISDLSPLKGLNNLKYLLLDNNSISDISPLKGLTNLIRLELHNNSISDISPLVANTGLGEGDLVEVSENPLNPVSINTHIPALVHRRVTVYFDKLVDIPDSNLRTAIEKALGKASGVTITTEDMKSLYELEAPNASITDLTGLEHATNLTLLTLSDNSISDISPLAGLNNLAELYLSDNSISDISPLAGLNNLIWLELRNNSISDISPLKGLNNLAFLYLEDNSISDISPLAGLTNLRILGLSGNSISDISPVAGLINLIELSLENNSISDLSPLVANTGLGPGNAVLVEGNPLNNAAINTHIPALVDRRVRVGFDKPFDKPVDIPNSNLRTAIEKALRKASDAPITTEDMKSLYELEAPNASITDLTGLEHATSLTWLILNNNSISDISPLKGLTNLVRLNLNNNSISDLSPLVANTGLGEGDLVEVSENPLNPVSINTHIPTLQRRGVSVDFDKPVNIIPDSNLRTAIEKALGKASGAPITTEDMKSLYELEAPNASITDLTGLEHATNLTLLELGNNFISDISPLKRLTNLTRLDLNNNSISDLSPLVANTGLGRGDTVLVEGNPLNYAAINTHIPALVDRRVRVDFDTVDIPDSNLRAEIEKALGKASGVTITTEDMKHLPQLIAPNASITDLTGLEHATNLTLLTLSDNSISDISPLAGLNNLIWLELRNNSISDISPLKGLNNLAFLYLEDNSISDISPLAGLTNLRILGLSGNSISDISPVAGLINLIELSLENNFISDLSPLKGLTNLRRLELHNNSISDISPLVANTGLGPGDVIIVNGNPLNNASINTHIPTLISRGVRVDFDKPVDIPDPNLRAEIEKDLSKASSDTITTADMKRLTDLEAPNANITDLTGLEHATNLTLLDLDNNSISDISPLTGLTQLTVLFLGNNSISDISPLTGLTNLKTLVLENNSISDISPLAGLTNLTQLRLYINSISDISPLAGLTQLTSLGLGRNNISDISPLAGLTNLTTLTLWTNSISDLSPLVANTGLGEGDRIDVSENPLNSASINTHIPALQSRGVEVYFDALEPATPEYLLSIPAGISLIHVPLKVTTVDGVPKTIESISNLYDALGGASKVNFLITYDSQTQEWRSYFGASDRGGLADVRLADDKGIIASLRAPVSVRLTGNPLGTNGSGTITINPGLNLVGLPLNDSRINRVSDLFALDGIGGNVPVIILTDGGEFKLVGRADDPGDIEITGGQAFIMTASREAAVDISGDGWTNVSGTAAAPPMALTGIEVGDTTPVLGLRGAVVDQGTGVNQVGLRVTVKNLSTRRAVAAVTGPDAAGYQLTVVDIETGRAAQIGDILEISAQSPNPFIGVKPLRYTVTAEDVKQSPIQLPELVSYEIPAETELLHNYPNPFNPETWIPYRLAEDAFVTLTIYDLNGQIVRTLDVGHQTAAVYENRSKAVYWDGRNGLGEQVASGVYFYHLSAGEFSATRKMVILK